MRHAGQFREVVKVLRRATPTADKDELGQPEDQYIPYVNRPTERCSIRPVSGAEIEQAQQNVGLVVFMVEMHHREDITADTILRWTSRRSPVYLNVKSVPADPEGNRMWIQFLAMQTDEPV